MNSSVVAPTNEQLMQAFYNGRTEALGMLAARLRPALETYAYSRLPERLPGRRQKAEDLVQDAFLKVCKTLGQPNGWRQAGGANVSTWLHTIVRNLVTSFLRGWRCEKAISETGHGGGEVTSERAENLFVDGRQARQTETQAREAKTGAVREAVQRLSDKKRQIIQMYYFEQQTYKGIARQLGVVPSTVMRWVVAFHQELRHIMAA